jgi:FtsH-binding integral membrane protein
VLKDLFKMNTLVFSFIVALAVTVLCIWLKGKDNKENNSQYAVKVFAVTAIVVFVVHTYMSGNGELSGGASPEIDVGEPPF